MVAVSESTLGPIGVNMATYVGFVSGMDTNGVTFAVLGVAIATLGLVAPSIIVILIIASILKSFRDSRYINDIFYGLCPSSAGLITADGLNVFPACFCGCFCARVQYSLKQLERLDPRDCFVAVDKPSQRNEESSSNGVYRGVCRNRRHFLHGLTDITLI